MASLGYQPSLENTQDTPLSQNQRYISFGLRRYIPTDVTKLVRIIATDSS